ncbi:Metallo-hydrolase/oxidoreductase [Rickenella mellea]|uniref:Metallo-hydrolase/oxidoreductase n=1 Tax=Rickenella mellea TaxID=50990 RepID=A0A4Y7PYF7_9AGAM|nr:Metallo-hydrolase/oxidoreductase [Rickenella mellea]
MESLKALPNVGRLSDNVLRILGQNPGKFTLQGTNTYLIGHHHPYILVDTGEGRDQYPPILESALDDAPRGSDHSQPLVSDIVITHHHHDHFGGLPGVLSILRKLWDKSITPGAIYKPPRLHMYPMPPGSADEKLRSLLHSLPQGSFDPSSTGALHDLKEGQRLSAAGVSLEVIHTPGHTTDSICLFLPQEKAMFTADSVLGQGTALFEDLGSYMSSLQKLLDFRDQSDHDYSKVYPGHGPVVDDGPSLIATYIAHRKEREEQIVQVLRNPPPSDKGVWTLWDIVAVIYKDYPENLWLPAAHGVGLHLKKLEDEGRVEFLGGEGVGMKWKATAKL